ncbi:MAG: ABC transporter permease [Leptospiraceae bacterium]|nr:ABC transporter permease [Leptospiraceae bacterium]MCK6380620.1 ABC transporter permease [Leptospiraceae bacterium]
MKFFLDIFKNRNLLFSLAIQDFKQRYLGNYLGIVWAFTGPLMTVVILFFVFQVGFRSAPTDGVPFFLWLVSGMFPWFFLSESISSGSMSIIDKPYLVKKIVFRVSTLPVIKLISALFIHAFFLLLLTVILFYYGYFPKLIWIQVLYYLFATQIFVLGISWATSSVIVFVKDLSQMIGIFLQFGFWLTPIIWSHKMMPEQYLFYLKLNPAYYLVQGYRDSVLYNTWFWEKPYYTLYFWVVTICIFLFGAFLFNRLRPHFADAL